MTIRVNSWYRVKTTRQFCLIQKIPSTTDPRVSITEATETSRGFELAVTWYAPVDDALQKWTKRAMILQIGKAVGLFREPGEEDLPIIEKIKSIAQTIPVFTASRDGEFTIPI